MLWLVVPEHGATVFSAAVGALIRSSVASVASVASVRVRCAVAEEPGFVPRLEDDASGRWIAIVTEADAVVPASEALVLGASAVLVRDMSFDEFGAALGSLAESGAAYLPAKLLVSMAAQAAAQPKVRHIPDDLTRRELEVLALVARGHSNTEIARLLSISENTVRTHLRSLCSKLNVSGRARLASTGWTMGIAARE
jgi:two-component system response regulator NreC